MFSLPFRLSLGLLISGMSFTACSSGDEPNAAVARASSTSSTTATPTTTVPTTSSTMPDATCAENESVAIAAVIEAQTSAIAKADFAGALQFSSTMFRSSITVEQFERMIAYEYNFLLQNPSITVTSCQSVGESRDVIVQLDSQRRHIMAYVLTPEDGRWRIDVAALLGELESLTA